MNSNCKNILMVVRWPVGGIRTYLKYVFKNWQGLEVKLTFLMPRSQEVESLISETYSIDVNWLLHSEENPSFKNWLLFTRKAIKSGNWDLVHCQGFTSAISSSLWLNGGVPSLFTSHDVLLEEQFLGLRGSIKKFIIGRLLARFNVVQAVSNDGMENMLNYFPVIKDTKLKVIQNGVDTDRFFGAIAKDLRLENGISEDVILIGFFGRFMAQKGFKYLVDALVDLSRSGVKLHCLCYGAGAYIREEKAWIKARGVENLFSFQGFEPDISSCVKGVDLVAMPSLWEACPLQPMEVLSAGVPFVGTRCIGLREVCNNTPAVLCEPGDVSDLKRAIEKALSMPAEIFENFAAEAAERYNKSKMQREYEVLYREMLTN